ncbi:beta-ketoacyl synthase chain length factor [Niabella aquatica]
MYIHQHTCISPQQTNSALPPEEISVSADGKLLAKEPVLEGVPPAMLRRMSKAVRMGIGAGLPLIKNNDINGIIIGSANGGMEDCIQFLNQLIDYDEGLLTPTNFVQSTPNAIAGQLSLLTQNRGYNATHVHNGLAFENALLDAQMLINEHPGHNYLVGGVDEISSYNYNIDYLAGWYSKTKTSNELYTSDLPATIAGEGATMFIVNNNPDKALAKLKAIQIFHSGDDRLVTEKFTQFISQNVPHRDNTIFITGENGDNRFIPLYVKCEEAFGSAIPVVRYKHITGEYPTVSSFALWLACQALQLQNLPPHFYKNEHNLTQIKHIILYNQYQGRQHSFTFVTQ